MTEQLFHIGVKALVTREDGKFLLLQVNSKKLSGDQPAYWDIPGGRIQEGDSVLTTLSREVQEELGVSIIGEPEFFSSTIANIQIPTKEHGRVGLALMVYKTFIDQNQQIQISDEHVAFEWVDRAETAQRLMHKYQPDFTAKLLS